MGWLVCECASAWIAKRRSRLGLEEGEIEGFEWETVFEYDGNFCADFEGVGCEVDIKT